jgi:hypothetical protein
MNNFYNGAFFSGGFFSVGNFYGGAFFSGNFFSGIINAIEQTLVKLRSFTERRRF